MKINLVSCFILLSSFSFAVDDLIISELNPNNFSPDFSSYDPKTALFCGQLSEIVYYKEPKIQAIYDKITETYPGKKLSFDFIDNKKIHTQCLLWCTTDFLIVSFRGTEPSHLKDILTDGKFWNYENNPSQNDTLANMPIGHGGFRGALIKLILEDDLFGCIKSIILRTNPDADLTDFPIYVTGHSLGAGISQLFIECLDFKGYNFSGAYHFAPPLSIDCSEIKTMREKYGEITYDIINFKDYIPRAGRNGTSHFGKYYRICDDGLIYKEVDAFVKFNGMEYFKWLRYHRLKNHLSAIRNCDNTIEKITDRSEGNFPCMSEGIHVIDPCGN